MILVSRCFVKWQKKNSKIKRNIPYPSTCERERVIASFGVLDKNYFLLGILLEKYPTVGLWESTIVCPFGGDTCESDYQSLFT